MQRLLAIQDLSARLDRGTVGRPEFADRCSALIASAVGCSTAAFWLLMESDAGSTVRPLSRSGPRAGWGLRLDAPCDDFAASLQCEGAVIAQDARAHAATAGFFDPAQPAASAVRSLMAVPFSINGDLYGAFVCAQFEQPVRWSAAQLSTLRRVAASVTPPLARATSFNMSTRPAELAEPRWIRREAGGVFAWGDLP